MQPATASDPLIGRTFGNVRLTARLGAGAMGVVYRGWHDRFDREVAVKLLINKGNDKPSYRERFLREGKAAAKVSNEHVVQVLDAGQQDNIAYLVMELVNGLSLGSILDEAGLLEPEVVQRLGVGMSLGLAAIHAKSILHRDIKPDNILVGSDRKPKIADLGLAKQVDEPELMRLTATGTVVGTPLYLSPEAIRDPQSIGSKSDVYSLGATLYQMLVGKPPFTGATPFEVMRGHLDLKVTPIRLQRPGVPQALAEIVELCLSKDAARRPTALELADLLTQGARPPRPFPRLLVSAVVVGLCLIAAVGWLALRHQAQPATSGIADPSTPATTPAQARLHIVADAPVLRVRVDDGPWQAVEAQGIATAPGAHRLLVEAVQDGPLLRGAAKGSVTAGENANLNVNLTMVDAATPARIAVPGNGGMIFIDGAAYGPDPAVICSKAGRFSVARWAEETWHSTVVNVDDAGHFADPAWASSDKPPTNAYWTTRSNEGQTIPAHHVVCWWEAERARAARNLPPPLRWTAQASQPEQPALYLTIPLVQACTEELKRIGAALPDRSHGIDLAGVLQTSLWCQEQGRIEKVGGNEASAQLVVVPP